MTHSTSRTKNAVAPLGWDDDWKDAPDEADLPPLTPHEADELRARLPVLSPWAVVGAQSLAGVLCVVLAALVGPRHAAWSALWGVIAVVLPSVVMARGLTRHSIKLATAMLFSLALWESIKILMSIAILVAIALRVRELVWPAMLVTMFVCLKMNWLILLWRGRVKKTR